MDKCAALLLYSPVLVFYLKIPEDVEPPSTREDVGLVAGLEVLVCRHCVVDPPQPAGHEVSQQHVNTSESKYEVEIQCNARQYL